MASERRRICCRDSESSRCYICGRGVPGREPRERRVLGPLLQRWEPTAMVAGRNAARAGGGDGR